jgi:hypothetical protein
MVTGDWVGEKPCLMTVDTLAYVTVARPDIAAGWPERHPNQRFTLHTVSGETLSVLNGNVPDSDLGAGPIQNFGFRRKYHIRVRLGAGPTARI